jgi:predicted ester cyclase
MTTEENKTLVRRMHEQVWNKGNVDILDELMSPDFVDSDAESGFSLLGPAASADGIAAAKQAALAYRAAFADLQFTFEDQVAEGDKVVTRWAAQGTHTGPLGRIPPTGKHGSITGIFIDRLAAGRVVEEWTSFDALGLLHQLGVLPGPARSQ